MDELHQQQADLDRLRRIGRRRILIPCTGVDFSSNDYLALANSDELREAALRALRNGTSTGSGGSRLLRGNCAEHEELEQAAARFFGAESALFFFNGICRQFGAFGNVATA